MRLQALLDEDRFDDARALVSSMEQLQTAFDEATWQTLVEMEARALNETAALDRFEGLLNAGYSPREKTFYSLLIMYRELGKPDQGIAVFEEMLHRGFLPDADACAEVISLYLLALDDPRRAAELLQYMVEQNLEPSSQLYAVLVQYYANKLDMVPVTSVLEELASVSDGSRRGHLRAIQEAYVPVFQLLGMRGQVDDVEHLYSVMQLFPDVLSLNVCATVLEQFAQSPRKQYKAFAIFDHMIRRLKLIPSRAFCSAIAGIFAKSELLCSISDLRDLAAGKLSAQRMLPASRLLFYLKWPSVDPDAVDRPLSASEIKVLLQDISSWQTAYHKHRRTRELPA